MPSDLRRDVEPRWLDQRQQGAWRHIIAGATMMMEQLGLEVPAG